ncbi:MAG: hypothetical protein CMH28_08930 [Micavibrio sp.]|nr:hypothetical protein [Micavibrio sp.]
MSRPSYLPSNGYVTGSGFRTSNMDAQISEATGLPGPVSNISADFSSNASPWGFSGPSAEMDMSSAL